VNLNSPKAVRDFLRLSLLRQDKEVFLGIFLDAQNRVVAVEELSSGTLTQTSVFPREVVKRALGRNAAALIFAQNSKSSGKPLFLYSASTLAKIYGGNDGGTCQTLTHS
jgi:DNA repair protein RadC